MRCAAASGLRAGVESRWGSLGGRAPRLGPCAAFGWGDALGSPSWRAQRRVLVKGEALPCFLFALQPRQGTKIKKCVSLNKEQIEAVEVAKIQTWYGDNEDTAALRQITYGSLAWCTVTLYACL